MENKMEVFKNERFGEVRTVVIDNEPWFVAADVCRALEIGNTSMVLGRLDEDEKGVSSIDTLGGVQEMTIVNEPGLYSLVLGSRKPEAKQFKRWITHDVIPSIREHGVYMTNDFIEKVIDDPDLIIRLAIQLKEERARANRLEEINRANQPKVEYFDNLIDRNLLTNFRDTAKELHVKQNEFIAYLLENGYVYRDAKQKLLPYAQHVEDGLFELKEYANRYNGQCGTQTLITPKGRETFRVLMGIR